MAPQKDARSSITSTKSAFLNAQIRLLDTPLTTPPSHDFIPNAAIHKIISSVSKKILQQNKLAYPLETRRHVLEQIDGVYWRDVLAAGLPVRKAQTVVRKEVNLQNKEHGVHSLPEEWTDVVLGESDEVGHGNDRALVAGEEDDEAIRYQQVRDRMIARLQQRKNLQKRLAQYKQLQLLLRPLEKPKENIQPNLVTRDNKALETELAKTRVLLARVAHTIQQQPRTDSSRTVPEERSSPVSTNAQKLEDLLGLG